MDDGASTARHWDAAYRDGDTGLSWYQREPTMSLRMLDRCGVGPDDSVIDVGAGGSTLVDSLVTRGFRDVTALDISAVGLQLAQQRLGGSADSVEWVVADLLSWRPVRTFQVWHDRAVFHFLTTDNAQHRYLDVLHEATTEGSVAIFATFAVDGPRQCSGLPVARYRADDLAGLLPDWKLIAEDREEHTTPGGRMQPFTWAAFRLP